MKKKIFYCGVTAVLIASVFWLVNHAFQSNALDADPSPIQIDYHLITPTSIARQKTALKDLVTTNPEVSSYLLEFCYGLDLSSDSTYQKGITDFASQTYIKRTEKVLKESFGDLSRHEQIISSAFARLHFHFKNLEIPKDIIFANSNFNYNATCYKNSILVGLERYMGGENPVIIETLNPTDFPEWIRKGMNEEFMDRDVLSSWISTLLVPETNRYHIEEMIRWGKVHLITEMSLRIENKEIETEMILRWTKKQYEWAKTNEGKFWKYLMDEELLYDGNEKNRAFLINNGPYTIGLPEESPDRMGQYLGYTMVKDYVFNEGIAIETLPSIDYRKILKSYNPN